MRQTWLKYSILILLIFFVSPMYIIAGGKFRVWDISSESKRAMLTFKNVEYPEKKITPQAVLDYLFQKEKEFYVKIILIKNNVAYVNIEGNSDYITQRSGTTGALFFAAKIVFSLTEFDNIDYVYFVDEGDHFLMGKSERLNFWHLMSDYRKNLYKKELENRLNSKDHLVYSYVGMLADIGDDDSIRQLEDFKIQCKEISNCCNNEAIDEAIKKIKSRINKK